MFLLPLLPHEPLILAGILHCHEGEVGGHLILVHVNTTNDADPVNSAINTTALTGSYVKEHNWVVLGGKGRRREGLGEKEEEEEEEEEKKWGGKRRKEEESE